MTKLRTGLTRLAQSTDGVGMVEFAAAVPLLVLLVLGISDASVGLSTKLNLQQALNRSLEMAAVQNLQEDYSPVRAEAAAAAGVPVDNVTLSTWLECDGVRGEMDEVCASGAEIARYLSIEITSSFEPMFAYGPIGRSAGVSADGTYPIRVSGHVRLH